MQLYILHDVHVRYSHCDSIHQLLYIYSVHIIMEYVPFMLQLESLIVLRLYIIMLGGKYCLHCMVL